MNGRFAVGGGEVRFAGWLNTSVNQPILRASDFDTMSVKALIQPNVFLVMITGITIGLVFLVPTIGAWSILFILPVLVLLGILMVVNNQKLRDSNQ
ncbi:hypothetical protein FLK61_39390 [Paenalkalicoccus suaedae]|uniref:Uncharacterized protein n=1 Tax=Paenalkalicoccus suaedae TaxID=2592382 RepID=A0A859FII9_9BACI|nr:hypothetical protein [Paenalkalicoccus suaedae]QKS72680.1 hypothetical protein FLK61_39390 [Paenalkalicoccus suaedae]